MCYGSFSTRNGSKSTCFVCLGICPTGWIEFNDYCYLFAKNGPGVNWYNARDYCASAGGILADILDQKTQDFVKQSGDSNIFWWLGGYKTSTVSGNYSAISI